MIVGVTVDPRAYDTRIPVFPGSRMCRVFGYQSKALPSWAPTTGDRRVADLRAMVPGIQPACVFQDWPDDTTVRSRLTAWMDEVDADCDLTWHHEHDRKKDDPQVVKERYYLMSQWAAEHPNGHHITLVPTQTYQWTMTRGSGKGAGNWGKHYIGIGEPGVDAYANSWEARYPDPGVWLAPVWRHRDAIRRNIRFPEFGAARVAGDAHGNGRAEFIYQCAQIMRREGVTAVCYWDDLGTGGTDLRLWSETPDTPEVEAWRRVIEESTPAEPPSA